MPPANSVCPVCAGMLALPDLPLSAWIWTPVDGACPCWVCPACAEWWHLYHRAVVVVATGED